MLSVFYHGVVKDKNSLINGRHLLEQEFERQLIHFKENYNIVTLAEMFELKRTNTIPEKKTISISFDDGYENNLTVALPILEKYKIPATFFISSICLEDPEYIFWPDVIDVIKTAHNLKEIESLDKKFVLKDGQFLSGQTNIYQYVKHSKAERRDQIIADLSRRYDLPAAKGKINREAWKIMNKEQLVQFANSPYVSIGSHGHLHYNLADTDEADVVSELRKSKQLLENVLSKRIDSFSFPDGSYNTKVKELALSEGYTDLVAVNYRTPDDILDKNIIRRFGISCTTSFEANVILTSLAFNNHGI